MKLWSAIDFTKNENLNTIQTKRKSKYRFTVSNEANSLLLLQTKPFVLTVSNDEL